MRDAHGDDLERVGCSVGLNRLIRRIEWVTVNHCRNGGELWKTTPIFTVQNGSETADDVWRRGRETWVRRKTSQWLANERNKIARAIR